MEELLGINCVKGGKEKRWHTELKSLCLRDMGEGVGRGGGSTLTSTLLVLRHVTRNGISLLSRLISILDVSDPHVCLSAQAASQHVCMQPLIFQHHVSVPVPSM